MIKGHQHTSTKKGTTPDGVFLKLFVGRELKGKPTKLGAPRLRYTRLSFNVTLRVAGQCLHVSMAASAMSLEMQENWNN